MLLHLDERDKNVCVAAKGAVRECFTFIAHLQDDAELKIKQISSKPHMHIAHETEVGELYDDVASVWVLHFPGMMREYMLQTVSFTRSPTELLRRNAAWILGAFVSRIAPGELSRCGVEQVSASLVELVGAAEKSETVRVAAAHGIGLFSGI
ncbi:hypothetical protein DQ04_00661140 [Trypanosoma grayi]|uniref:hypothetical protein n=1 Tax=Trypanosoma grayi TaxID=71804 RepID=UPI0004F4045E|nr:hypothetical protein DQ04_00661140 [Trypanosoma grayi]KEG14036.1 hypothetical protein DQ04_00661140 [Trypanosoma grayi]